MGNLVADRIGIDSDPELIRRQVLLDRERQMAAISNPQQQLAARLGGLLGGGIANIAQDRGFFEVNDPLLNKVSKIQGVYNDVASRIDPASNPQEFFKELSAAYTNAGLGKEALKAAQEAQKASTLNMETQLKEAQLYATRPELLSQRIEDALKAGNEAEAMRLAQMNQRILEGKDLEKRKTEAQIKREEAQASEIYDRIKSGKFSFSVIQDINKVPVGVQVFNNKTGEIEFKKMDPAVTQSFLTMVGGSGSTTTDNKGGVDKDAIRNVIKGGSTRSSVNPDVTGSTADMLNMGTAQLTADELRRPAPAAASRAVVPNNQAAGFLSDLSNFSANAPAQTVNQVELEQQLNFAIQRAYPQIPFANILMLSPEQKAVLAQQAGIR